MKKTCLLILALILLLSASFHVHIFAEEDIEAPDDTQLSDPENPDGDDAENADPDGDEEGNGDDAENAPSSAATSSTALDIEHFCFCGRPFYTKDGDGHYKYDCTKCGKNMYLCTCDCWCGASTYWDTTGNWGAVLPLMCSDCDKPCLLCDCKDNKEEIIRAEQLRKTGEITSLNVSRPENGAIVIWAVVFSAVIFLAVTVLELLGVSNAEKIPVPSGTLLFEEDDEPENTPTKAKRPRPDELETETDGSFAVYEMTNDIMFKLNKRSDTCPMYEALARAISENDGTVKLGDVPDSDKWVADILYADENVDRREEQ